jgi:cytochrome c
MKRTMIVLSGLVLASGAALAADGAKDDAMLKLATQSGCLTCHQVEPGGKGPDGMAPIGPAWREVALKYKGDKTAADTLVHTVMAGSNPYESHWKGKVSGLAMPPNKVAITEADTKKLVGWILKLDPPKMP